MNVMLSTVPSSKSNGHARVIAMPPNALCACGSVRRASRAVSQLYDLVMAPTGIKSTQFFILQTILNAGEIAQCQLARDYDMSVETLSRRLGNLRRKGLVELRNGPANREHVYRLTPAGEQMVKDVQPYWDRAQSRLRAVMGEEQWQQLFEAMERIAQAAHKAYNLRTSNRSAGSSC